MQERSILRSPSLLKHSDTRQVNFPSLNLESCHFFFPWGMPKSSPRNPTHSFMVKLKMCSFYEVFDSSISTRTTSSLLAITILPTYLSHNIYCFFFTLWFLYGLPPLLEHKIPGNRTRVPFSFVPTFLVFSAKARSSRNAHQMNERLLTGRERVPV